MKPHNRIATYFKGAFEEFSKVTWPTKEQAALLTGIVIGVSLIVGVYLGLLDLGFSQGYQALLKAVPVSTTDTSTTPSSTPVTSSPGVTAPDGVQVQTQPVAPSDSSSQQ